MRAAADPANAIRKLDRIVGQIVHLRVLGMTDPVAGQRLQMSAAMHKQVSGQGKHGSIACIGPARRSKGQAKAGVIAMVLAKKTRAHVAGIIWHGR